MAPLGLTVVKRVGFISSQISLLFIPFSHNSDCVNAASDKTNGDAFAEMLVTMAGRAKCSPE